MEVIDAHQHIGDLSNILGDGGSGGSSLGLQEEQQRRAAGLKAQGIDWAVIQPAHGYLKPDGIKDTMRVNDGVAEYRNMDPAHFGIAAGTVEPTHGERSLEEIDRIKQELKLEAVSWHHRFQGCFIDNVWMRPILRRMSDLGLAAIFHTNSESGLEAPWRLQKLAQEFPDMNFLALDAFFTHGGTQYLEYLAELTPNVVWDVGGPTRISIDSWVKNHGSRNITFAVGPSYADRPNPKRPQILDEILEAPISDEDKANILHGNIRRVFGLEGGN